MKEINHMKHLRALIAVVECGSVVSASKRLLRTASAVANSVRQLEGSFGVPLFERESSGMKPTRFGTTVYERGRRIQRELELAAKELAHLQASPTSPVFAMQVGERQLSILVRLQEMGHMPSVAAVMGMSQPAVSMVLRQVEKSVQTPLFRRSSKGMAVTEAGEMLLFRIRRSLAELRHLEADIAEQRGKISGQVTFAALPSLRTRVLPRAVGDLISQYPDVRLSMVDAPFEILFAGVRSGDIDFILSGLDASDFNDREFRVRVIGRDALVPIVRRGHPLCTRKNLAVADLLAYPWVLRNRGAPTRELLYGLFDQLGLPQPRVSMQTGDLGLLRGLLENSDAVTAISPEHLASEIASHSLVILDLEWPATTRPIGFMLRRDAQPSSLCEKLMQYVSREAQKILLPAT